MATGIKRERMRRDDRAAGEESMEIELEWQGHRLSMNSLAKSGSLRQTALPTPFPQLSNQLKTAGTLFKMSWHLKCLAAAFDPVCNPSGHLFIRDAWLAEELKRLLRVAEQRVVGFLSVELHGLAEALGKIFGDTAYAEHLWAGDV